MKLKKVINLYGGPGVGKSTIACSIFSKMKRSGYNVEYVDEYAKEKTYEKETLKLEDQLYILAKQHRKFYRLINEVEYIVTDSPILLSCIYFIDSKIYDEFLFKSFVMSLYNQYPNMNIVLRRNPCYKYSTVGRLQSCEESILIDKQIETFLKDNSIFATSVFVNDNVDDYILKIIS